MMRSERFDHWFDRDTQTLVELDHRRHVVHDEIDLIENRSSVRQGDTPSGSRATARRLPDPRSLCEGGMDYATVLRRSACRSRGRWMSSCVLYRNEARCMLPRERFPAPHELNWTAAADFLNLQADSSVLPGGLSGSDRILAATTNPQCKE
jgi:hypothetical protein